MLSKITTLIACFLLSANSFGQYTELFADEECKVSYAIKTAFLLLSIEDLKPKSVCSKDYARKATAGDYTGRNGTVQVEFDKNNNGSFDNNDWGMFTEYGNSNPMIGYSLYSNWQGLYIHKLNKGFDVPTKTQVIKTSGSWDGSQPTKWELQFPLKEVMSTTSKKINFQVSIYRQPDPNLWGVFLELPKRKDEFRNTFEIPIASNTINAEAQKHKAQATVQKANYSKTKYVTKIEYDGIYIDLGNGKFAELSESTGDNGVIAAMYGTRPDYYYKDVPYLTSLSKTVLVPLCKKIILKGSDFQGDFLKWLTVHEMENLAELNVEKTSGTGRQVTIKTVAYAGKFGSSYSLKSDQPENLYTPAINKQTLQDWVALDYNTKTLNANTLEIKIASPLQKGKTYCLWSGKSYYLFELQ